LPTVDELAGAATVMREHATTFSTSIDTAKILDTAGTGGAPKIFNVSTLAAIVAASAGAFVAKHGNRSVSSQCGSADLLEVLGVKLDTDPEIVEEAVQEIGIGFLFAPLYHGAMRHAARARKELGLRSIFNMLGPLTNPAGANCQLLGVYAPELTEMFAHALQLLGTKRAFVVHGHDGLDEISVCAPTRISELKDGLIRTYDISPEQFFGKLSDSNDLLGGNPEENSKITRKILDGEKGPKRDVVLINSAAALVAAEQAENLQEGIRMAEISIDRGAAVEKMEALIRYTQENG